MKNFAAVGAALCASFVFNSTSAIAANFTINNQTSTSTQSLSNGQTGVVTSTGTLSIASGTGITIAGTSTLTTNQIKITNSGVIKDGTGRTIRDQSGDSNSLITNNAGALIQGAGNDVIALNVNGSATSSASSMDIENYGTIQSLDAGGTGATTPTAKGNQAINLTVSTGSTVVDNFSTGVIWATAADSVRPGTNGVVHNDGLIFSNAYYAPSTEGTSSDGIDGQTASGITIVNGYTTSAPGVAEYTGAITGYVGNQADVAGKTQSTIEGGRHGITGGNTGTNTSTLPYQDTLNPSTPGVYTMNITNNQGATIKGDDGSGVNIDGFGGTGVDPNNLTKSVTFEVVTIQNRGLISGDGVTRDGDGVDVDGAVILNNSGTIVSKNAVPESGSPAGTVEFSEGVTVGGGTIVNTGTIEGSVAAGNTSAVGRGITLAGVDKGANDDQIPIESVYQYHDPSTGTLVAPSITNSGLIKGDSESGIAVLGTTGGGSAVSITNNAGGVIEGNNSGVSEDSVIASGPDAGQSSGYSLNQGAIELDDAGNSYLINNAGTIQQDGASGVAVAMHGATNTLNITGGSAKVLGSIDGGTGASTVNINTGAGNVFNYGYTVKGNTTVNVAAGSTLAAGGTQPTTASATNTAVGNLTLDTTNFVTGTGPNTNSIMNVTSATLQFALGAGDANSGSKIIVTGGTANTITFSASTVAINDLTGGNLVAGQEYVLIDGDNTTYQNLQTGAVTSLGTQITGGLELLGADTAGNTFSSEYSNSELYLQDDNIVVDVVATPEPSAWGLGLIALGGFAVLRLRQRANAAA